MRHLFSDACKIANDKITKYKGYKIYTTEVDIINFILIEWRIPSLPLIDYDYHIFFFGQINN